MERHFTCANCDRVVCGTENYMDGPENCPTRTMSGTLEDVRGEYEKPDVAEFARQASIQEYECYLRLPEGMNAEEIGAHAENGILEVTIPRRPEILPRKVKVDVT